VVPQLWLPWDDNDTRVPTGAHPRVLPWPLSTPGCPSDPDLRSLSCKDRLLVPTPHGPHAGRAPAGASRRCQQHTGPVPRPGI